ncbi:hypothetical protein GBA52_007316 [Prunus armeniaca]|nr:hypothetical protein GBA52_007316 [Prunus armeniaca]
MDTERFGIDSSGKGRNGGEELKDTKLPMPTPRKSGGLLGVFEGRDGMLVSGYGTIH